MSPEGTVLYQLLAEERARLRALARRDIAALRQLVDEAQLLMDDVLRERTAAQHSRALGVADAPPPVGERAACD